MKIAKCISVLLSLLISVCGTESANFKLLVLRMRYDLYVISNDVLNSHEFYSFVLDYTVNVNPCTWLHKFSFVQELNGPFFIYFWDFQFFHLQYAFTYPEANNK